jgi:hypothetical protein
VRLFNRPECLGITDTTLRRDLSPQSFGCLASAPAATLAIEGESRWPSELDTLSFG